MLFQSPKPIHENLFNENVFPSQSFLLNQNLNSYCNLSNFTNKYSIETPHQKKNSLNNFSIYNDINIDSNTNKEILYKRITNTINSDLKPTSNNLGNLINTPLFENICCKIFFPKEDPFHLSSIKKSPKNNDNNAKNENNSSKNSLLNKEDNKEIINNNINYNQSTKRKSNGNLPSSQTKKRKDIILSYSIVKSLRSRDKKENTSKIIKENITKNKNFRNELLPLFENEKMDACEKISLISSTKAKSNNISENKTKRNLIKKKINSKKSKIKHYSKRSKKYNILSEETKRKLLLDAKHMRTIEVAKKYGISTRNINRWKKKGIRRKRGSGRKFKDPSLEKKLLIWYNFQDKRKITSRGFREKALELSNSNNFRASSGWLTTMKKKYHIKFRKE